ncbi:MerR family transcriptional regulator [Micrococcus luteus]|uniref:transcriptional regulator FtsR n=1 Tax=Micrococcus luteus TaxID=1270 RepID=UPI002040520B|nr:MerR family transcriptional regulator [Micrococcus luteus]MCV7531974.1 MerR family transcriptional regulator [Micrococcus luteus]
MTDPRPRPDAVPTARPAGRLGIGEVVAALEAEFPGVTASKVRFLEDRGLVLPERTLAGYRRFRPEDVDRLRFVLALQRDHFLPLKVIADHLAALDRGERPTGLPGTAAVPASSDAERLGREVAGGRRSWTRAELAAESGAGEELLAELDQYSLLPVDADGGYPSHAMDVARAAVVLAGHGLEPRHLRPLRAAADRELGLVERAVAPLQARRDAGTRPRVARSAREIAQATLRLHAALVAEGLEQWDD